MQRKSLNSKIPNSSIVDILADWERNWKNERYGYWYLSDSKGLLMLFVWIVHLMNWYLWGCVTTTTRIMVCWFGIVDVESTDCISRCFGNTYSLILVSLYVNCSMQFIWCRLMSIMLQSIKPKPTSATITIISNRNPPRCVAAESIRPLQRRRRDVQWIGVVMLMWCWHLGAL